MSSVCGVPYIAAVLKGAKCEIFDFLDFHDFYVIKPLWVCDFGTGIKKSKAERA
jgi:hypothetical protein